MRDNNNKERAEREREPEGSDNNTAEMDDEPPVFLAYQPYKGPASIPHAPADFFGAFFLATNVSETLPSSLNEGRGRRSHSRPPLSPLPHPPPPTPSHHNHEHQQSAMLWHMFPGKFMGTEVRARRHE